MTLAVIVPSRGRPSNAWRLHEALGDVDHIFAVDSTDPTLSGYDGLPQVRFDGHPTMIEKLNGVAVSLATGYEFLGFMGDDHLPRTEGWGSKVRAALKSNPLGIVYCDDGHQGENLPTAVFMHSLVVRRLGWMALPTVGHLYCDNAWLDLGRALGSCTYLADVLIEHLHPHAGKAAGDEQYQRVNSAERTHADREAWERWREEQLADDVLRVLA